MLRQPWASTVLFACIQSVALALNYPLASSPAAIAAGERSAGSRTFKKFITQKTWRMMRRVTSVKIPRMGRGKRKNRIARRRIHLN
jgi:hypothetical protein